LSTQHAKVSNHLIGIKNFEKRCQPKMQKLLIT